MDHIDFRSDTVTWPTPNMREAMARAKVGDDVYGEDPTVNELEALAADLVGKKGALFVSSGTMGNLVGVLSQATRGDGVIIGLDAHAFGSEAGSLSALGGVVPQPIVTGWDGRMDLRVIEDMISPDDPHYAPTRMIALENTYAAKGGIPLPVEYFQEIRGLADGHGLKIHLDGARLFNAAVACGVTADQITSQVDSVSFCLSKGLCAPVGSLVCGDEQFIYQAKRIRKALGGAMRQAGIIAAAGIVALKEMIGRLAEDHENARILAEGLAEIQGIDIDLAAVQTNIIYFYLQDHVRGNAQIIADRFKKEANILIDVAGNRKFRALTHYWVGKQEIDSLLTAFNRLIIEYS